MIMFTLYFWLICSFPGFYDSDKSMVSYYNYVNWYYTTNTNIYRSYDAFWFTLNCFSTFFTIISIRKIFIITNTLSLTNSHVMIDKKILILHVLVMSLQLISSFGYIIPNIFPRMSNSID